MAEPENLNVPMIATVGIISVVLTVASVVAVQALYYNYFDYENQRKVVEAPTADADSKIAEQVAKLSRYTWVKSRKGSRHDSNRTCHDIGCSRAKNQQPTCGRGE